MLKQEQVVYESIDPCPYLEGERMRTPLRYQLRPVHPQAQDVLFAFGDRRYGKMLYRTDCPSCVACEPLRIPVHQFTRSKSQRKVWNRNQDVLVEIVPTRATHSKVEMFNQHKRAQGMVRDQGSLTQSGYKEWFVDSCTTTLEFLYYIDGQLVCVSVLDLGENDASSVYVFYDMNYTRRSLGTFSALYEMEWMKEQNKRYYYLGLYVKDCAHLNYKNRFYPHDRLFDGEWHRFLSRKKSRSEAFAVPHIEAQEPRGD